jgi:hypothetical protein
MSSSSSAPILSTMSVAFVSTVHRNASGSDSRAFVESVFGSGS